MSKFHRLLQGKLPFSFSISLTIYISASEADRKFPLGNLLPSVRPCWTVVSLSSRLIFLITKISSQYYWEILFFQQVMGSWYKCANYGAIFQVLLTISLIILSCSSGNPHRCEQSLLWLRFANNKTAASYKWLVKFLQNCFPLSLSTQLQPHILFHAILILQGKINFKKLKLQGFFTIWILNHCWLKLMRTLKT